MRRLFPCLYFVLILSQFMIGQIYIPGLPLNMLQISTLLLLTCCIMIDRKLPHDRYIVMYLLFLLFYILSSMLTGYTAILFGNVLPQVLISFTVFWSTKILVQRYDTLLPLIIPAVLAGVIDSVVTIFQAIGKPILSPIVLFLMQNPDALDVAQEGVLGMAVSGLFMNPVFNGHSLLFCFVCSLFLLQGRYKFVGFSLSTIILIGLFFCQQRSAFYLALFALIIIGWKLMQYNIKTKIFVVFSSLVFFFYLLPRIQSYAIDSGSRLSDISMAGRDQIWTLASDFISNHILLGGFEMFIDQYGVYPHNLFLSGFLAGGLIGGIILVVLICMILYSAFKSLLQFSKQNIALVVNTCLVIVLIADSMTHNTGLVEADFSTFLAMSLFYYYNKHKAYKLFKTDY